MTFLNIALHVLPPKFTQTPVVKMINNLIMFSGNGIKENLLWSYFFVNIKWKWKPKKRNPRFSKFQFHPLHNIGCCQHLHIFEKTEEIIETLMSVKTKRQNGCLRSLQIMKARRPAYTLPWNFSARSLSFYLLLFAFQKSFQIHLFYNENKT